MTKANAKDEKFDPAQNYKAASDTLHEELIGIIGNVLPGNEAPPAIAIANAISEMIQSAILLIPPLVIAPPEADTIKGLEHRAENLKKSIVQLENQVKALKKV